MLDRIKARGRGRIFAEVSTILVVAFLASNVHPYDAPEPLWTEEDLARAAPGADNGWTVVTAKFESEIPEQLEPLVEPSDHDAEQFWQRVEQRADDLHEFMGSDAAREASERVELARRHTVLTDVCAPDQPCETLGWRKLHRFAALQSVDLAARGDLAGSCTLLGDLIRMDVGHVESARSLVSFLIALANLQEALDRADMIAQRSDANPALAELSRVVRGVDVEAIDLRNVVIGEYLAHVEILESLDRDEPGTFERIGAPGWSSWMYSEALTLRDVNERFEQRYRAAAEQDSLGAMGGGESSPRQQFGWWLRNAVGKVFVDMATVKPEKWASMIDEDLAELERTRALMLGRPAAQ